MTDAPRISGSIRRRLMFWLVSAAAILALLLYFVVRNYAAQIAQNAQDSILETSAQTILDAASIRNGEPKVEMPYSAFSILNTSADDRVFYAIHLNDDFVSGYEALGHYPVGTNAPSFTNDTFLGASIRRATLERVLIGPSGRTVLGVTIAQTQEELSNVLARISRNATLIGLAFFAVTALLSFWIARATTKPLSHLANSVQRRGPQDLRPVSQPVPSEMSPLVGSLNNLMVRLDHSLKQSEDFIAEAAHRVRTPLATVRSYAETTLQRVEKPENRKALRSMVRAIDESSRAAGQLLDHAMITFRADHLAREPVDLAELARDLVERMRPIAEMRDIEMIFASEADVIVEVDAILLQNAARNLLDNALKYSPIETDVSIEVLKDPPRLIVKDQGPGFPPDQIANLSSRFVRGDNVGEHIGSGLGLTIAQEVAEAHGGTLTLENNKGGGACAILSL